MSSPKDKAQDLFDKMYSAMPHQSTTNAQTYIIAKQCAIEAVDEIMNFMEKDDKESKTCYWANHPTLSYWYKVKEEISNL